jgi:hypothetical protein
VRKTLHQQRLTVLFVSAALAFSSAVPASAPAAQGDCGQPISNGTAPLASDCLYILQTAVFLQTCTPECICAPKGSLPITATDARLCLSAATGQQVPFDCPCPRVTTTSSSTTTQSSTTTSMSTTTSSIQPLASTTFDFTSTTVPEFFFHGSAYDAPDAELQIRGAAMCCESNDGLSCEAELFSLAEVVARIDTGVSLR